MFLFVCLLCICVRLSDEYGDGHPWGETNYCSRISIVPVSSGCFLFPHFFVSIISSTTTRETMPLSIPSPMSIWLILVCCGTVAFFGLPGFNDYLYVRASTNPSCVTAEEFKWILASSLLLWLPSSYADRTTVPSRPFITTTSCAFRLFVTLNILWMLAALYQPSHRWKAQPWSWEFLSSVGGMTAWPAMWNMALVVLPVQRTWAVLRHWGISHAEAHTFHRWAGYAMLVWLSLHTIILTIVYLGKTNSLGEFATLMLPYRHPIYTEGIVNFMGWMSFLSLALLCGLSMFRHHHFEWFWVSHVFLALAMIVFANFHDYNTVFFIQPAYCGWIADRLQRQWGSHRQRLVVHCEDSHEQTDEQTDERLDDINDTSTYVTLSTTPSPQIVALTFPIPPQWPRPLKPGMFVYFQSHPFSISRYDAVSFTVHVKALGDWTESYVKQVQAYLMNPTSTPPFKDDWQLEGPYGGSSAFWTILEQSRHCVFVAGGVGLTGVSAYLMSRPRSLSGTLVWLVRTRDELDALRPLLPQGNSEAQIAVHICQTRGTEQEESASPSVQSKAIPVSLRPTAGDTPSNPVMLFFALVSMLMSTLLARQICCSQPNPTRTHRVCSMAYVSSLTCNGCDVGDEYDPDRICCTVPVCYYCFRGLPLLLTLVVVPLGTWVLSLLWMLLQQRPACFRHSYNPTQTGETEPDGVMRIDAENPMEESTVEERATALVCDGQQQQQRQGSVRVAELLDTHATADSVLVVCGPESLLQAVQKEGRRRGLRVFLFPWRT